MNFVVRGSGDNIVLERKNSDGKGTSARPATVEEKLMYDKITTQKAAIETWQEVDSRHHAEKEALLDANSRLRAAHDGLVAERNMVMDQLEKALAKIGRLENQVHGVQVLLDSHAARNVTIPIRKVRAALGAEPAAVQADLDSND